MILINEYNFAYPLLKFLSFYGCSPRPIVENETLTSWILNYSLQLFEDHCKSYPVLKHKLSLSLTKFVYQKNIALKMEQQSNED